MGAYFLVLSLCSDARQYTSDTGAASFAATIYLHYLKNPHLISNEILNTSILKVINLKKDRDPSDKKL